MREIKIITVPALALAAGLGLAACGSQTPSHAAPAKAAASKAPVAVPSSAAPAATQAPAPAATTPAAPQTLLSFTGHGNGSTPKFTSDGDFTVKWTYSGNTMSVTPGYTTPDLFGVVMHSPGSADEGQFGRDSALNNPSDISASGSGDQTISDDDGTHYFTVQSDVSSTWTITVVTS